VESGVTAIGNDSGGVMTQEPVGPAVAALDSQLLELP
jgi:hypothetical protein